MGWSDADALGVGESSQGMDADAVGSGIGGDAVGNFFDKNYVDKYGLRTLAQQRANLGLPAFSQTGMVHSPEVQAYLDQLQQTIDYYGRLNQGALLPGQVSNTPHNSQLAFVDLMDPNLLDPMGGGVGAIPAGAYSFGGGVPTDANPNADIDGGGDGYYIRKPHRLAYENAYDQWESDR